MTERDRNLKSGRGVRPAEEFLLRKGTGKEEFPGEDLL